MLSFPTLYSLPFSVLFHNSIYIFIFLTNDIPFSSLPHHSIFLPVLLFVFWLPFVHSTVFAVVPCLISFSLFNFSFLLTLVLPNLSSSPPPSRRQTTIRGCCCTSSPSCWLSVSSSSTCLWALWWRTSTSVASTRRWRRPNGGRRNASVAWRRRGEVRPREAWEIKQKGGTGIHGNGLW